MKILVTAGGGGHFAAALAVIHAMPKEIEYVVVGRKYAFEADKTLSFEYKISEELHIPFRWITASRYPHHFDKHALPSLVRFPKSFYQAYKIIQQERPSVILSFGGYTSVPVVLAGAMRHIPIIIHEQTLQAGLANRIAKYFAKTICVSWDEAAKYFPKKKTVLTGNPLRLDLMMGEDFFEDNSVEKSVPIIYITGGSLGSHVINQLIEGVLEKLLRKYILIHQTGAAEEYKDYERLEAIKNSLPSTLQKRYMLTKFIRPHALGSILKKVDLVISRAGINTISELLYFGKVALLIPLPISQNNEQMENALFFKKQALGEVFPQHTLTSEKLYEHIVSMVTHKNRYEANAQRAKELIDLTASKKIIDVCKSVVL